MSELNATMERYAQLSGQAGDAVRTIVLVIEADADPDGTNGQWVLCGDHGPGSTTADDGLTFMTAEVPEDPVDPCEWLIDIGPFSDRLGTAAVAIDLSTVPGLVAIRSDFGRRKWIDLKDARVIAAVNYLAGHAHPALGTLAQPLLTDIQAQSVLTAPVQVSENLALRKLYF